MLAEEFIVLDGDSRLWQAVRPLLDTALRLEQNEESYSWHGWSKQQVNGFLEKLPPQCSIVVGVWETVPVVEEATAEREELRVGFVCEIVAGEVRSVRTFEALNATGLKSIEQLEPGIEDALAIMHAAREQVAPVAWALFTDKATWDAWLFTTGDEGSVIDKGELLTAFTQWGRCVLLGSGGEQWNRRPH